MEGLEDGRESGVEQWIELDAWRCVTGRLTDVCVIAAKDIVLLWCKTVVGEERCLEKLSECG